MASQWMDDERDLTEIVPYTLMVGSDVYFDFGALCKEILVELEEQKWNFYGCEDVFEDGLEEDLEWDGFDDTDIVTETDTETESDSDIDDNEDIMSYSNGNRFFYT